MSKAMQYVTESLAASGLALVDGQIAFTLRPGLWATGMEAFGDMSAQSFRNSLGHLLGANRYRVRLAGIDREMLLLARSDDALSDRVLWITGRPVQQLGSWDERRGPAEPAAPAPAKQPRPLDPLARVEAVEPARNCLSCTHMSAGHVCKVNALSWLAEPSAAHPRRCLSYAPVWGAADARDGKQLWPELVKVAEAAGHAAS